MLLCILLAFGISLAPEDSLQQLKSYRWESRLVLLFAPARKDPDLQQQLRSFEKVTRELRDRDVVVLAFSPPADHPALRKHFRINSSLFVAILIGKDGEEKWRSTKPFSPTELLGRIDAMPMGMEEAKRRKTLP